MNPSTSHLVVWLPAPYPPVRYLDESQGLCLTVKNGIAQKATLAEDPAGLSYVNSTGRRVLPLDRSLHVERCRLILKDRETELTLPLNPNLQVRPSQPDESPISPVDWRAVFVQGIPRISPTEAFEAVPLFHEDDAEIGELAAQSFVADYLDDLGEQDREVGKLRSLAERVLIVNGDAVISTCILFDRPRDYTVNVRYAAYAQRQAQQLWAQCAEVQRWDWLQRIRMTVENTYEGSSANGAPYDLIYQWLPYDSFDSSATMRMVVTRLSHMLRQGGEAFVVGSAQLKDLLKQERLRLLVQWDQPVASLPTFLMHKTILPKARLKSGLTLFRIGRL